jgi:pilus assembly protein CpaB
MKGTSQKLILISFILALLAAIVAFIYLQSLKAPKETANNTAILVAVDNIPARTLIDKKMVKEIEVTDNSIFSDYIKNSTEVIGKYTKDPILKNEGFLKEKLLSEGGQELSLKIDKKHRAFTINITGDGGVAKLIKPADFVDIIVYLPEKKDGEKVVRTETSRIMLQNLEILAIESQITREDTSTDKAKEKETVVTTFLVTLSVPTNALEKLVLAESIGSLKLALRPLKTDETNETDGTTWEELMVDIKTDNKESNLEVKPTEDSRLQEENKTLEEDKPVGNIDNSSKYKYYTIKTGDTLRSISKAFYGDPSKYTLIKEANNIKNDNMIIVGRVLKIPEK